MLQEKKTEEAPKESHTIVLEKIGEGEDEEKLSEGEWTKIVQKDVKKTLMIIVNQKYPQVVCFTLVSLDGQESAHGGTTMFIWIGIF